MITDTECGDFWFDNFIIQYIELGLAWAIFITIYIKFSHLITKFLGLNCLNVVIMIYNQRQFRSHYKSQKYKIKILTIRI